MKIRILITGGTSLSDDVLVVLGIDADLCVVHGPDQFLGLGLESLSGLLGLVRGTFDLDDVAAVRKFNMDLDHMKIVLLANQILAG
jgi:hypothetical protein